MGAEWNGRCGCSSELLLSIISEPCSQVKDEGYEVEHDGFLVTIFSAPNYCDQARCV